MKRTYLLVALCLLIPVFSFADWVDTGGSTWTAVDATQEIKDIDNAEHDAGAASRRIVVTSGVLTDVYNIVATSDTKTHTKLDAQFRLISTNTAVILTETEKGYVRDSTGTSVVLTEIEKGYVLNSTNTAVILTETEKQYVLTSSNTAVELTEMQKAHVQNSTAADTTITRLDTVNTNLDKIYVLISTNTAVELTEMEKMYVLTSSNTLVELTEREKQYVLSSTNTIVVLTEMEKNYVMVSTGTEAMLAALTSLVSSVEHCDTHDVVITSGVVRKMQVINSTGTVLTVTNGSTVSYAPQDSVVELFIAAIDDNTDTIRFRFYDENVATAGHPMYVGTEKIIDTWKSTIYFESESGTQKVIVNEVYE